MPNLKYILELCQFSTNGKPQNTPTLWRSHGHMKRGDYDFLQLS